MPRKKKVAVVEEVEIEEELEEDLEEELEVAEEAYANRRKGER